MLCYQHRAHEGKCRADTTHGRFSLEACGEDGNAGLRKIGVLICLFFDFCVAGALSQGHCILEASTPLLGCSPTGRLEISLYLMSS